MSLVFGMNRRHGCFDIFKCQLKLLGIGLLGPCAKQGSFEVSNQLFQLIYTILLALSAALRGDQ